MSPVSAPEIPVGLSTASVWPLRAGAAFELAAELGYDGVEVMVWADPISQDVAAVRRWSKRTGVPILSIHSPSLLITQRIWSPDPEVRLRKSVQAAAELGARTVVVHPPFRWQRRYGDAFGDLVDELEDASGIEIAVENMFKVRPPGGSRNARVSAFRPSIDPTDVGFRHYTLDLSHSAAARMDALQLAERMGAGLSHVHLADGTGVPKDEHLIPGHGDQPCAELLEKLVSDAFAGQVVLEVNTRHAVTTAERARALAEALLFARLHLGQ
ncbi:sugar phosphate isomerase/epimerase family protein [Amycolatopsis rhabdoformis]|uniref:Sugar phosphate isomerase/epimerase family protein n=1 Tax=Amycolatopsis rhabdoformis TaxID=1448059 RepID=A0ABZ1I585_9PSEU|nr:sugar phosphate isomerase/epimerase family protein [Amycolatopsis rhabdoformis]WSE28937.1 sugar phosphate isomerase/epimerase family protein [Amycolatopsis rhabdoformis]